MFWQDKSLQEMSDTEWEQLCDHCARCCLLKLEDEETGELFYTSVSCHLLNIEQCRCKDYANREVLMPACLQVRKMSISEYQWLPDTCAYKLLSAGKPLADWHPLISGDVNTVAAAGITIEGFAMSEEYVHPEQLEEHIIYFKDID